MSRVAKWNTELGRSLYNEGQSYAVIAERCETTQNAAANYAKRYWPRRASGVEHRAKCVQTMSAPPKFKAKPLPEGATTLPPLMSLTFGD